MIIQSGEDLKLINRLGKNSVSAGRKKLKMVVFMEI
jgi:hypothetical protein